MAIRIEDLQLSASVLLPRAYLRIDRVSGGKQDGYWNYLVNIYPDKGTAQAEYPPPTLSLNLAVPFENGNPINIGYTAMKEEGKIRQMLQLQYSSQVDD